ncbi:hypothetical protein SteCoe_31359 [Stentor coeruleus]|uniref:Uncharacterized protein n=1 Tax=Stentor coeruleus TaxID=5963 RepID=A0A1R2B1J2_9CILI|nr:hypothetical protein SteCoe_31359 [Stentor coeruleus]
MESFKCFYYTCAESPELLCQCDFPPIYICRHHQEFYKSIQSNHNIKTIPNTFHITSSKYRIKISDKLYSSQKYFLAPGSGLMNFYKFEVSTVSLTEDYKSAFNSMARILISQIMRIPRGNTQEIIKEVHAFVQAMKEIVKNIYLNENDIAKTLSMHFDEMHSKIESKIIRLIENLIKTLVKNNLMKETSGIFFKKSVFELKEQFFSNILITGFDESNIINNFLSVFKCFFINEDALMKYLYEFQSNYYIYYRNTTEICKLRMLGYILNIYENIEYQIIVVYKPTSNFDKETQTIIPEWIYTYSALMKKEPVEVAQCIEVAPNENLVLLHFKNSSIYSLFLISELSSYPIMDFQAADVIIASGSTKYDLVIIQNFYGDKPSKYLLCSITEYKLIKQDKIFIELRPSVYIKSVCYIDKSIIFVTTDGKAYMKQLNNDKSSCLLNIDLHPKDQIVSVRYKQKQKIILIKSLEYVYLMTNNVEEIYRLKVSGNDVEIADDSTGTMIFFYEIYGKNMFYSILRLKDTDIDRLGFYNEEDTNFLRKDTSKLLSTLIHLISDEDVNEEKSVYQEYINKSFFPISVKPEGYIIDDDSDVDLEYRKFS